MRDTSIKGYERFVQVFQTILTATRSAARERTAVGAIRGTLAVCGAISFLCCGLAVPAISEPVSDSSLCITSGGNPRPTANFENRVVQEALDNLMQIRLGSLYIYSESRKLYPQERSIPKVFLNVLCSEYHDNAAMLHAKFKLLSEMVRVPEFKEQRYNPDLALWGQLTGEGYRRLVFLMYQVSKFRKARLKAPAFGRRAPAPVSVCEMRFIFRDYLANYREVNNEPEAAAYQKSLEAFLKTAVRSGACDKEDLDTLFVFRGEGPLDPRAPESRIMDAVGRSYNSLCTPRHAGKSQSNEVKKICDNYFQRPFGERYKANLAAARSLFFYPREHHKLMSMPGSPIIFLDKSDGNPVMPMLLLAMPKTNESNELKGLTRRFYSAATGNNKAPFSGVSKRLIHLLTQAVSPEGAELFYTLGDFLWKKHHSDQPDEGWSGIFPIGRKTVRLAYDRLASVFDRHTYYYRTSFYMSLSKLYYLAATPWHSSSYYISQSHKFTFSGFPLGQMRKPIMQWMFIYKINRRDYYSIDKLMNGDSFDLDSSWFNEREFTTHPYGLEELALNRLGVPAAPEFEALLYLSGVDAPSELLNLARSENNANVHSVADGQFNWSPK